MEPEPAPEASFGLPLFPLSNAKGPGRRPRNRNFIPRTSVVKLTSYHEFLGQAHLGAYALNTKVNQFDSVDREFKKEKSVFRDWRLDRPKAVGEGFMDEISYWKVPNFVKDEEECAKIAAFMKENSAFLKTLFIVRSSASYFPVIRWLSYAPMVLEWEITDA